MLILTENYEKSNQRANLNCPPVRTRMAKLAQ